MKLTRITMSFGNSGGSLGSMEFSFRDPKATKPYVVREIVGLDADAVTPQFAGNSAGGFKQYNMKGESKERVFQLLFNPNWEAGDTYSSLRDELYRAIEAARSPFVIFGFYNGLEYVAGFSGLITKMESTLFEKQPAATMTVRSDDPILRGELVGLDLDEVISHPDGGSDRIGFYDTSSTKAHGFTFEATVGAGIPYLLIEDGIFEPADWFFQVDYAFLAGDHIYFSSLEGDRYLYIMRGATRIELMDKVVSGSAWPMFYPKYNAIDVKTNTLTWVNVSHQTAYWGV